MNQYKDIQNYNSCLKISDLTTETYSNIIESFNYQEMMMVNSRICYSRFMLNVLILFAASFILFGFKSQQNLQPQPKSQITQKSDIAFARIDGIYTMRSDGTNAVRIISESRAYNDDPFIASPDGKWIVLMNRDSVERDNAISLINLSTKKRFDYPAFKVMARDMVFTHDSSKIIYVSSINNKSCLFSILLNSTKPSLIAENKTGDWIDGHSISPDGKKMVLTNIPCKPGLDIWQFNFETKKTIQLTKIGDAHSPSFSPDGKTILFSRDSGIFEIKSDGTGMRQITNINNDKGAIEHGHPSFSPDGKLIAFHRIWKTGKMISIDEESDDVPELGAMICTIKPDGTNMKKMVPGWCPCWINAK